jgi:signal transduction histidine kinase
MPQMFRNLSIRSKLVGLLAVPVAGAALLSAVGVAAGVDERVRAGREQRVAAVVGLAATAAHELQEERARAAAWVAGSGRRGAGELRARRQRVDRALADYRAGAAGLGPTGDTALDQAVAASAERLDRLAVVRAEADRRLVTPERSVSDYDATVAALLSAAHGLASRLDAPEPARRARLLLAVAGAKEATGQERSLLAAIPPGARLDPGSPGSRVPRTGSLRARLVAAAAVARHELNGVRAAAGDRLDSVDRALATPGVRSVRSLELALLDPTLAGPVAGRRGAAAGEPSPGDLEPWRVGLTERAAALRRLERSVAGQLAAATRAWQLEQQSRLRTQLVVLAAVAAVALVAAWPLRNPVGPHNPTEGAASGTVVGLAWRGRALLDRQLQLVDELERDEPDPERRRGLLRLHHQAARLRRNSETLLAMTGAEPVRRADRPVPLVGLLRAAIAEADASRRVDLLATDEVEVAGTAGVDLIHLVAELLDNAAAFSPPTAAITMTGAAEGDDYLVEVSDRGLGMTNEELAWANQRLAGRRTATPDLAAGDRLGLVIVGRLAGPHGLRVQLSRSPTGGVTAAVRLPASLLSPRAPAPAHRS